MMTCHEEAPRRHALDAVDRDILVETARMNLMYVLRAEKKVTGLLSAQKEKLEDAVDAAIQDYGQMRTREKDLAFMITPSITLFVYAQGKHIFAVHWGVKKKY